MSSQRLRLGSALTTLLMSVSFTALAQTTVSGERNTALETATDGDITIETGGTVDVGSGTNVTLNSDNAIIHNGIIRSNDNNDVTGVLIQGGNTGSYTQSGSINLAEDFTPEDTDEDGIVDGAFASGENRTGILISGASPFTGNVELTQDASITIEGNDSFGLRMMNAASTGLIGDLTNRAAISVTGNNATAISLAGNITGDVSLGVPFTDPDTGAATSAGTITSRGENARAIHIEDNVSGHVDIAGTISNSGYRFLTRPGLTTRNNLDASDLLQASSAIELNGDVGDGVNIAADIEQFAGAPAVLIDGQGTPIAIGVFGDFSTESGDQYGFLNRGTITSSGLYNDVSSTATQLADVNIANGLFNSGSVTSTTVRSGDDGVADSPGFDGHARAYYLAANVTTADFVNQGLIVAQVSEATDEIYEDIDNVIPARLVQATAIEISADSMVTRLINSGSIQAISIGRTTDTTAIIDRSGSLSVLENTGRISAVNTNSDSTGNAATNFTATALDLSANTSGVTITQSQDSENLAPFILGDILLGSGADNLTSTAGVISGDLSFGAGADILSLTDTTYAGTLSDSDGDLAITAVNSSITHTSTDDINVQSASFDADSSFTTVLDVASGDGGALIASDTISFADGAEVNIRLENVINGADQTFTVAEADSLTLSGAAEALDSGNNPFLYDFAYAQQSDALVVTLTQRDGEALGLDSRQAAGFDRLFEGIVANSELGAAFANITDGDEFQSGINQLLPEISASALYFIQANVDGAIGGIGSHLENQRHSQDRKGGAWINQFTYFADREIDEQSEKFRGHGFGFNGGLDTALGPFHSVGGQIGFASTQVEDVLGVDQPLNITTFSGGLYAGAEYNDFSLDLYAGGGYNDIESERRVRIGDFSGQSSGEWSGTHIAGSARLGYTSDFSDRFWARPVVSLDYLRLDEDAFRETGDIGIALAVDERTSERAGISAILNAGMHFNRDKDTWIKAALRGGIRSDFMGDPVLTNYNLIDLPSGAELVDGASASALSGQVAKSGVLAGLSIMAGSSYSNFSFDFDSDIRDGFIRHTGRFVVRLLF